MTPKTLFLRDKEKASRHRELVANPEVEESLMQAFNQFCWADLPLPETVEASVRANAMRTGVQSFITTFLNLGSDAPPPKQIRSTGTLVPQDNAYRTRHTRTD